MKLNKLTSEEKNIIENKGTEAPFSGEYNDFFVPGVFVCRRCNAPLYRSENKFNSHCGWPSFDAEILGAVKRNLDADGRRTEITCARCGAHLGHVFAGEKLTEKNTRHCVNSLALKFLVDEEAKKMKKEVAYFGGGCFWCTEAVFKKIKGVMATMPGYAGGNPPAGGKNPTYAEVSTGATGHAEVTMIEFDPLKISFEALLSVFFATHDPTTPNRQGADVGTQYRSIILYANDLQKEIAEKFIRQLEAEKIYNSKIVTEIKPLEKFWPAEECHRNYFEKNPDAGYCQAVINPKLKKLREKYEEYIK